MNIVPPEDLRPLQEHSKSVIHCHGTTFHFPQGSRCFLRACPTSHCPVLYGSQEIQCVRKFGFPNISYERWIKVSIPLAATEIDSRNLTFERYQGEWNYNKVGIY